LEKCLEVLKWFSGVVVFFFVLAIAGGEEGKRASDAVPGDTVEERKLFLDGKDLYEVTCLSCHQANGMGQEALAPALVGSHWVTNSVERLVRIALHGMRGPVKVNGRVHEFPAEMPPLAVLSDDQLAGVLTYVRREWGHKASAITPAIVAKVREATREREQAWTEGELLRIP
jgi:mono/diheme cytochrome c family protein